MTHAWHDIYQHAATPAHHLDPRSKVFAGLVFVIAVLLTPHWGPIQMAGYPLLLATAFFLAGLSPIALISRMIKLLPFVILMMFSAIFSKFSLREAGEAVAKGVLSITAMAIVSMTTPFPDFLRALEQCHCPSLLVMFLAFLYRYAAVLGKEMLRVERGWKSRSFGRFWWREWSKLGHVLAALLIRSYERAERVYAAMMSRGFSSRMPMIQVLHFGSRDLYFVSVSCVLLVAVCVGKF